MKRLNIAVACLTVLSAGIASASSHREAPLITGTPKVDATDFYMFRSYETGRSGYTTLIANYQPLQDAYGGPNYYSMDPKAAYDIHVDNDGDAIPDITFRFKFRNFSRDTALNVGGMSVPVPLHNTGSFSSSSSTNLNWIEAYYITVLRPGEPEATGMNELSGNNTFIKPHDNIGTKSIQDYQAYSDKYISRLGYEGCASESRVFVGQRNDSFSVNLGEIFDLIHTNPVGPANGERNIIADKNVTTIALEVPTACLSKPGEPVIGAWTTAKLVRDNGQMYQASRLSAPLVNEVVIGLPDKDKFNASNPRDDAQFAKYVTNPTLPELIQALFGVTAPNSFPRNDLVAAFLTGIDGLNKPASVTPSEMMRLNTSIAPKPAISQQNLGVLAGDTAGFPNGRRPGDDVVDIELRVAMGVLLPESDAPDGQLPYTDGATVMATDFRNTFPYLNTPIPGATDDAAAVALKLR
jgi:hypothetical protein